MQAPRILVAGLGSILLGDNGFGVEVTRRMAESTTLPGVGVIDFGIRGLDLAYCLLEEFDLVILIEAVARGDAPGTLHLIEPNLSSMEMPEMGDEMLGAPAGQAGKILQLAASMGAKFGRVLIVGCEPTPLKSNRKIEMDLSQPVREAIDEAIDLIESCVNGFGLTAAAT